MPKLNNYLSSLLTSFSKAKTMSDLQTVEIAEAYEKHRLLKHFSIPRMKIDDVELTIPIAIESLVEPPNANVKPFDVSSFNSLVYHTIVNSIGLKGLNKIQSSKLRAVISGETKKLEKEIIEVKNHRPLREYSEAVTQHVSNSLDDLTKRMDEPELEKIKSSLEKLPIKLERTLRPNVTIPSENDDFEQLNVIVESHKLREIPPSNIIQLKVRISEEGMEWDRVENNEGEVSTKLIPE